MQEKDETFDALWEVLENDPVNQARLANFGSSLGSEEIPLPSTYRSVTHNLALAKDLYVLATA